MQTINVLHPHAVNVKIFRDDVRDTWSNINETSADTRRRAMIALEYNIQTWLRETSVNHFNKQQSFKIVNINQTETEGTLTISIWFTS